ncbi:pyrroline-5-carboxylate reductase [Aquimarina brevivitae]|uniref:Pyrroline-5-carboxylate reductase n=1 Tax=Aquimarina brevivitae TaxID=323412 RepID=A0A4Q7NYF9_9FLAO|nr:pyrroline-5-carboxylate reductase [Aquimarina brevivitae]RZS92476.1 pyrroline-5-carboxylate reductase [Aquimarina brevivitae]
MEKITLIGCGNLGKSILAGLLASELFSKDQITVVDKSKTNLSFVKDHYKIPVEDEIEPAVKNVKWIIVCVQPKQIDAVLQKLKGIITEDQVVISTVTGVAIAEIEAVLPNQKVVRVMPNTGAAKQLSMTCMAANAAATPALPMISKIFDTIGKTLVIEERLIQAATVLGASGIAFFLRFLRAMIQGGIQMGFHPEEAQLIAVQTAIGAATLVSENGTHPEMEIDKVTTPQGCTIAGLNEMEHQGLSSSVIKGVMASYEKINTIKS